MTNQEAFREFVRGMAFVFLVLIVLLAIVLALGKPGNKSGEKITIVDHYGNCAIIRYTDDTDRWHYFLDCQNQHLQ